MLYLKDLPVKTLFLVKSSSILKKQNYRDLQYIDFYSASKKINCLCGKNFLNVSAEMNCLNYFIQDLQICSKATYCGIYLLVNPNLLLLCTSLHQWHLTQQAIQQWRLLLLPSSLHGIHKIPCKSIII